MYIKVTKNILTYLNHFPFQMLVMYYATFFITLADFVVINVLNLLLLIRPCTTGRWHNTLNMNILLVINLFIWNTVSDNYTFMIYIATLICSFTVSTIIQKWYLSDSN